MSVFNVELIKTVDDSYQIETGYDLAQKLVEDLKNGLVGNISKFAVITDDIVKNLYADNIANLLSENGFNVKVYSFKNGEKSKTRATKEYIEDAMLADGLRRDCCIIAVGGGVVTDIAGFIAGTYGRGVPFINYATTLLAAADASVGGKTAVDTPLATNLIGIFNQPKKVYIDIAAWATLEQRQLYSGMAETIKHACLADREMFDYIAENIDKIYSFDKKACNYIAEKIRDNINISLDKKTGVITIDVKAQDPVICKTLADSMMVRLQNFITDYRTNKARVDVEYYKKLTADAKQEYERARQRYGSYADANMDIVLESYRAKRDDLENDMQLKYNTYSTMNTQLQAAMAKVQERTPAFTLVKGAAVPIMPAGPKRMIFVAAMLFLTILGTALYIAKDDILAADRH